MEDRARDITILLRKIDSRGIEKGRKRLNGRRRIHFSRIAKSPLPSAPNHYRQSLAFPGKGLLTHKPEGTKLEAASRAQSGRCANTQYSVESTHQRIDVDTVKDVLDDAQECSRLLH